MKTCARCGVPQPRAAFYADHSRLDGLQRHCKTCDRARLDQADAARRAQQPTPPLLRDEAALARFLAVHAEDVVAALTAATVDGAPLVVAYLHEWLCSPCPEPTDADSAGSSCWLRFLACVHADELVGRLPAVQPFVDAWDADPAAALAGAAETAPRPD